MLRNIRMHEACRQAAATAASYEENIGMQGCRKAENSSRATIGNRNAAMNRIRQEEMQRRWRPSLCSPRHFIIIGANEPIGHIACLAALPPIISTRFSMSGAALTAIFLSTRAYCVDGIQKWCSIYKPSSLIWPTFSVFVWIILCALEILRHDIHICLCTLNKSVSLISFT